MARRDDNIPEQFGGKPTHEDTVLQKFLKHPLKTLLAGATGMSPAHSVRNYVDAAYNARRAHQAVDTANLVVNELERREEQRFVAAEDGRRTGGPTATQPGKGR
jgi:hypothetical protein